MSLQTGGQLGSLMQAIIDPRSLQIMAYYVAGPRIHEESVLHTSDIREVGSLGAIVNDANDIMAVDTELVRLREVLSMQFSLIGKAVITDSKQRLGRVSDYAVDSESFKIMKLHVAQSIMRNLGNSALIIGRSQIVEITDEHIVVRSATVQQTTGLMQAINPFRRPKPSLAQE